WPADPAGCVGRRNVWALRSPLPVRAPRGAWRLYARQQERAAIAAKVIGELQSLEEIPAPEASNLAAAPDAAASAIDLAQGEGAARITRRVTVNPGVVQGGLEVNMVASECRFEV